MTLYHSNACLTTQPPKYLDIIVFRNNQPWCEALIFPAASVMEDSMRTCTHTERTCTHAHVPGACRACCPMHSERTCTHAHVPGASMASCPTHSERGHARMPTYLVLVGLAVALASLQLYLESFHADLEAVHRLDRSLGRRRVVEAHKACSERNDRTM